MHAPFTLEFCSVKVCHTSHLLFCLYLKGIGPKIDLYINQQRIASVIDTSYSHGEIGLLAYDSGHPNNPANPLVEVVFSNLKVWDL